jgi:hypothetical protein
LTTGGDDGLAQQLGYLDAKNMVWYSQADGLFVLEMPWHLLAGWQYGGVWAREDLPEHAKGRSFNVARVAAKHFDVGAKDAHRALAVPALDREYPFDSLLPAGKAAEAVQCVRGVGYHPIFLQKVGYAFKMPLLGGVWMER